MSVKITFNFAGEKVFSINDLLVLSFHMGWVWFFHCENESCGRALVCQVKEPEGRKHLVINNVSHSFEWLNLKFNM